MTDERLSEQAEYYRRRAAEYDATAYEDLGSRFRVIKNFVDPAQLTRQLSAIGWQCRVERDGNDWIVGEARLSPT